MQLELPFLRAARPDTARAVDFVRAHRARRYILRIRRDGSLRVTIPRGGSRREAEAFLAKHRQWAERERQRVAAAYAPTEWYAGHTILLGGVPVVLAVERRSGGALLRLGGCEVPVRDPDGNLRPHAETALRQMAIRDLVPRLRALAGRHDLTVARVIIRNQQSRWGSCSRGGVIALNFRLVQAPPEVCEYVLLHELMHLRQPNHSRRFWRLVQEACPDFREAERWLRIDGRALF